MEETIERLFVATHHLGITGWQRFAEIQTKHAAYGLRTKLDVIFLGARRQSFSQLFGQLGQVFVETLGLNKFERSHSGRYCYRIAGQSTGLIYRAEWRQTLHDVASSAESGSRQTATHHLTQRHQIRLDAVIALRALQADAETGHHFIQYQHRTMLGAQAAQGIQKLWLGCDQIHIARYWLDDHRSDFLAHFGEGAFQSRRIVVIEYRCQCSDFCRHTRRTRLPESQRAGTGFDQQAIGVPVVTTFKFDDA